MSIPKPLQWIGVGLAACISLWIVWIITEPDPIDSWGELDPEFEAALASLEAWDGTCDLAEPEIRALIEDSALILDGEALACLAGPFLDPGVWDGLLRPEKGKALDLLASHYYINRDPRVLALEICDLLPAVRIKARGDVITADFWIGKQPHRYARSLPKDQFEALNTVFDCPEWTGEQYLNYKEIGHP
ncbi:MAG: hypothetical protein AAF216_01675 [Pseudomonadota bacterium]